MEKISFEEAQVGDAIRLSWGAPFSEIVKINKRKVTLLNSYYDAGAPLFAARTEKVTFQREEFNQLWRKTWESEY